MVGEDQFFVLVGYSHVRINIYLSSRANQKMAEENGPVEFKNRRQFNLAYDYLSSEVHQRVIEGLTAVRSEVFDAVEKSKGGVADSLTLVGRGNGSLGVSLGGVDLTDEIPVDVRGYRVTRRRSDGLFVSNNSGFSKNLFGRAVVNYPCFMCLLFQQFI